MLLYMHYFGDNTAFVDLEGDYSNQLTQDQVN